RRGLAGRGLREAARDAPATRHQLLRGTDRRSSRRSGTGHPATRLRLMTSSVSSESAAGRYVGTRVQRVEDARLLTGRGTFVDDITCPGMLHACFVRSPFARARVGSVDVSAAV